ncbi:MAG: shikimate kinase [Pseudomonadota bacterium]
MRFALLGNSGSGKSTYAKVLAAKHGIAILDLDLDQIAWEPDAPTTLRSPQAAAEDVTAFCTSHEGWVVEGCYADLVRATLPFEPQLEFLDPGEAQCLANCLDRPWEPSKYASKAAQDENLEFLLTWVSAYYERDGDLSHQVHSALFDEYTGPKRRWVDRPAVT